MGGSTNTPATTSSTTVSKPWRGAAQYLNNSESTYDPNTGMYTMNADATKPMGAYQQLSNYVSQYGTLSPEQQALISQQQGTLGGRSSDLASLYGQNMGFAGDLSGGAYDVNLNPVGNVSTRGAYSSLGGLDPSKAYSQMLSGTPNNPYLQSMNQANINDAMQGYNDSVDSFMTQFMPSVSNDAFAAGQYGGSRQGIVEGLGAQQMLKNSRDLGIQAMDSGNQLYGGAYESAQNRMAGAADTLGGQALQTSQFNANLGLQNNDQAMQQAGFNLNNAMTGNQAANNAFNQNAAGQDQIYTQLQALLQAPQDQQQNALQFLLSGLHPGAGMGGTTNASQSMPIYNNTMGQVMGGASSLAGLMSAYGGQ
jgi:hypothetical protein